MRYIKIFFCSGLDNHWIVKAWNLARGLDMHISPDLHHILRLPFSGPKVAQKLVQLRIVISATC